MIRLATNLTLMLLSLSYLVLGALVPGFAAATWAPYAIATALLAALNLLMEARDA